MDRRYIEQEKRIKALELRFKQKVEDMAPMIYSAFCISLHRRHGFNYEEILDILKDSQELWRKAAWEDFDIIKTCSEETGIEMISYVTAESEEIEGDATV